MRCPTCGTTLRHAARVCLQCESYIEPTSRERARAVATVVERDLERAESQRLRPAVVEDSLEKATRGLTRWTWIALGSVLVLLLYFNGFL